MPIETITILHSSPEFTYPISVCQRVPKSLRYIDINSEIILLPVDLVEALTLPPKSPCLNTPLNVLIPERSEASPYYRTTHALTRRHEFSLSTPQASANLPNPAETLAKIPENTWHMYFLQLAILLTELESHG